MIDILISALTALFGAIMFNMMLSAFLEKREKFPGSIYIAAVFLLAVSLYLSNTLLKYTLLNIFVTTALIFLVSLLYQGSMRNRIFVSIMSSLMMTIVEMIVLFLITLIIGASAEDVVKNFGLKLFGTILSKMLSFAVFKIICSKVKKRNSTFLKPSYWFFFLIILSTSLFALGAISVSQVTNVVISNIFSAACGFGLLFSTFFSIYLYEHMSQQAEELANERLSKERAEATEKHLSEILVTQRQLKTLRHDLTNHMIALRSYFEAQDYANGLIYINNIQQMLDINSFINTGNTVIDAIINIKKATADSKDIEFKVNIQIPENLGIEPSDAAAVLGNALDNAIEACEKVKNRKRRIELSIMYDVGAIICKIKNTAAAYNALLKTTKTDIQNHGFGIESIKSVVKKYSGVYKIEYKDDDFILSFVIHEK